MIPHPHSVESLATIPIARRNWSGSEQELFALSAPLVDDVSHLAADLRDYIATQPVLLQGWQEFAGETQLDSRLYLRGHWVGDLGRRYPRGIGYGDPLDACVDYIFWRVLPTVSWGSPRFDPTVKFRATVMRWYSDDPQPGLVEASIRDASGQDHPIVAKWVYLVEDLDPDVPYPFETWVDADVVDEDDDAIEVTLPWGMETVSGDTRLTLSRTDVVALDETSES